MPAAAFTTPIAPIAALFVPLLAICLGLIRSTVDDTYFRLHMVAVMAGMAAGCLYWHRYRGLGFIPLMATVAAVSGLVAWAAQWYLATVAIATFVLGFAFIRGILYLVGRNSGLLLPALLAALIGFVMAGDINTVRKVPTPPIPAGWFAAVTGITAALAWVFVFRPTLELCAEPVLWIMYRVRASGPGAKEVPLRGPCLVIANHACWFDPFILAKVLPRPVTPMMTSRFYDLPVMSWFMRRVFRAIRVPEKPLKQDVPEEIEQAIAALDRGECLVVFPEGFLRRSEDKPLKRFGRGVWQILSARPDTPVVCCWIEGNWGSYASYFNGAPTKNKRPDFRRPIGVAVESPITVDPALLNSHLATRLELMNRVAAARRLLGLPELPRFELPALAENDDGKAPD